MRIHGTFRFASLLVAILGFMLVVSLKPSAAITPTPTLPRANVITLTPTLPPPRDTPSARITDQTHLPRAVTATPAPTNTLDPKASALDRAVSNSLAARSMRVNLDVDLTVSSGNESITLNIKADGFMTNLDNPTTFSAQFVLDAVLGNNPDSIRLEIRTANQVYYIRRVDSATGKSSRWIGINFDRLVKSTFPQLDLLMQGLLSGKLNIDTDLYLGFATAFGKFIRTRLLNPSGTPARYNTRIDILGFIRSKDGVPMLIKMIGGLAIPDMNAEELSKGWNMIRPLISTVIPKLDLEIETEIDPTKELVNRVTLDFQITYVDPQSLMTGNSDEIDVEITGSAGLSNYNVTYTVEVPTNVVMVESLDSKAVQDALQIK